MARLTVALAKEILGNRVGGVESNPASRGEVVAWCGPHGGIPLYTIATAQKLRADLDAEAAREYDEFERRQELC